MLEEKKCTICGNMYEATPGNFYRCKKSRKDGLTSMCKNCKKEIDKKYCEQNKEKRKTAGINYKKDNPDKVKANNKKYKQAHKEEILEYRRDYYKKNSKQIQKQNAKTRKPETQEERKLRCKRDSEHSRVRVHKYNAKKKKLDATLTKLEWDECVKFFENSCAYCGTETKLAKEHFIPVAKGGGFTKQNIVPACQKCNNSKRVKDFYEWYPEQEFYTKEREEKIINYLNTETTVAI